MDAGLGEVAARYEFCVSPLAATAWGRVTRRARRAGQAGFPSSFHARHVVRAGCCHCRTACARPRAATVWRRGKPRDRREVQEGSPNWCRDRRAVRVDYCPGQGQQVQGLQCPEQALSSAPQAQGRGSSYVWSFQSSLRLSPVCSTYFALLMIWQLRGRGAAGAGAPDTWENIPQ